MLIPTSQSIHDYEIPSILMILKSNEQNEVIILMYFLLILSR